MTAALNKILCPWETKYSLHKCIKGTFKEWTQKYLVFPGHLGSRTTASAANTPSGWGSATVLLTIAAFSADSDSADKRPVASGSCKAVSLWCLKPWVVDGDPPGPAGGAGSVVLSCWKKREVYIQFSLFSKMGVGGYSIKTVIFKIL